MNLSIYIYYTYIYYIYICIMYIYICIFKYQELIIFLGNDFGFKSLFPWFCRKSIGNGDFSMDDVGFLFPDHRLQGWHAKSSKTWCWADPNGDWWWQPVCKLRGCHYQNVACNGKLTIGRSFPRENREFPELC